MVLCSLDSFFNILVLGKDYCKSDMCDVRDILYSFQGTGTVGILRKVMFGLKKLTWATGEGKLSISNRVSKTVSVGV